MSSTADADRILGDLRKPSSLIVIGSNRPLLKWVGVALLAPYSSRVYWTDVQMAGEVLEPLDPIALHAVPEDRLQVVHPRDLQRDEEEARRVGAATATMLRADEPPESLRRISEFLRLPQRTQDRIASTSSSDEPSILVLSNAHRTVGLYHPESVAPMIRTIVNSGTVLALLWAEAPPAQRSIFDVVLHVEGGGPSRWREATLRSEQGISHGPLGSGRPCRLTDLGAVAAVLEKSIPAPQDS